MAGCRSTPSVAIRTCASRSSWPTWASPIGSPTATAPAAGRRPDLRQTARTGLIAAIDRYDPDYGTPFVPFAVACVVGELKRYLRDTSWRLHVPRPLEERALQLCRAADGLHQRLGRAPTTTELSEQLGMAEEDVLEGSGPCRAAWRCRLIGRSVAMAMRVSAI
jgi:Sigma-70 region 3/Sigma-70 region 2